MMTSAIVPVRDRISSLAKGLKVKKHTVLALMLRHNLSEDDVMALATIRKEYQTNLICIAGLLEFGLRANQIETVLEARSVINGSNEEHTGSGHGKGRLSAREICRFAQTFPDDVAIEDGLEEHLLDALACGNNLAFKGSVLKDLRKIAESHPGISLEAALELLSGTDPATPFLPIGHPVRGEDRGARGYKCTWHRS